MELPTIPAAQRLIESKETTMTRRIQRREWLKVAGFGLGAMATGDAMAAAANTAATPNASADTGKMPPPDVGQIVFQRRIPVKHRVDVFIAGGGPAGTAAALAARTQDAKVFVAEQHSCFGGMGTAGRIPVFMQFTDGINFLAGGMGERIFKRMKAEGPHVPGTIIDAEVLKRTYDALMVESGAGFSFYTTLIGVEKAGSRITHAICAAPSGIFAVEAKVFIDTTGNGDLSVMAGASFEKGDDEGNLMPGTLCSTWTGIDWKTYRANMAKGPQPDGVMLQKAFADGVFTVRDEHLTGMHYMGDDMGGGNIGHTFGVDGTDEVSLTKALVQGRTSLPEYERYYKNYLKGFENLRLVATGSLLGVRETRRIAGDYILNLQDYLKRAVFDDEIGRYAYAIDNHPSKPGKDTYEQHRKEFDEQFRYKKGESYGIPYRILTPRGLDNALVAGRCVSADRMVHGSIRVMPGCFITGQAAGVAAAMASSQEGLTHQVNVKDLQQRLKRLGGFLPNA
jgi:hypothetical protein